MPVYGFRFTTRLLLFIVVGFLACSDGPVGLEDAGSIEELERSLADSGHLECRDLVRDLWSRLGTLSREQRLGEIALAARECVRGIRYGMLTVMTTTSGEGTDPDGYEVTLDSTTLRVPANGMVSFEDVKPGRREVTLRDVAPHCRLVGGPRQSDVVTPHRPGRVAFEVVCDQGGDGPPPLDDPGYVALACSDLALGRTSAVPFDPIEVEGIPAELDRPLGARVVDEGGQTATFTFIESSGSSGEMIAPFHPSGLADGGPVTLTVTDGAHACPSIAFTILPLPAAPGAFSEIVGQLQEIAKLQAQAFGFSTDQLETGDPVTLPPHLWPAAVTWSIVGDPTNPNSLVSLTQGGLSDQELDLLDRIVARLDIASELAAEMAELQQLAGSASLSRNPLVLSDLGFGCVNIVDARELDFCMSLANSSEFKQAGATGEALSGLGRAFGLLGLIPTPVTQGVSTIAGVVLWVRQVSLDAMANILPSRFVPPMRAEYQKVFLEDEEGPGEWMAFVNATSMGWSMDQAIIESVFQFVGAKGGGFTDFLARFDFAEDGFDTVVANYVLTEVVNALIGAVGGAGAAHVEAKVSGPVDISEPLWSDRDATGQSVELTSHTEYEPVKTGTTLLEIRSKDGKFGFQQIRSGDLPIDVKTIQVHIEPGEATVEANEILVGYFTVTVENSAFPELVDIDRSNASMPLQGTASIRYAGDAVHLVSYTAPPTLDGLPDFLAVHHTAETGARSPEFDPPERNATAVIRGGRIVVSPDGICLEPGDTQQFQADVIGLQNTQVTWSETGGSGISSTGLLTAPPETGQVEVIATSVEKPGIEGRAVVQVGGCTCRWSVSVGGGRVDGREGDHASFSVGSSGSRIMAISFFDENVAPGSTTSTVSRTVPVGAIGTFSMPVIGTIGISPPDLSYGSGTEGGEEPVTTLFLTENTGEVLQGNLTGSVLVSGFESGMPTERVVSFSADFLISRDPGLSGIDPVSGLDINACEIGP